MTVKKFPEKWDREAITKAMALIKEYFNRPLPNEFIQLYLDDMDNMGHVEDDVKRFLYFNGNTMISRLTHDICQPFSYIYGAHGVPPQYLYDPATVKAYDIFIPMAEQWIIGLKEKRKLLKEQIAEQSPES